MKYNPDIHHRRSIRLQGYDYSSPGAYFVTICVQNRACLFGEIVDGEMELNDAGHFICIKCGNINPKLTYVGDYFTIQKCDKCNIYLTDLESMFAIFQYFANIEVPSDSYYKRFNKFSKYSGDYLWTVMNKNFISPKLKIGYFELEKLNSYLEMINGLNKDRKNSLLIKIIF